MRTKTSILTTSWGTGMIEESESETVSDTSGVRITDYNNKKFKYKIPEMDDSHYEGKSNIHELKRMYSIPG